MNKRGHCLTRLVLDLLSSKKTAYIFKKNVILLLIYMFCNLQVGRKNIQGVGLENVELLFRGEIYTTSCRLTNDTAKASFDMGRNAHITFVARFTNYQGETCLQKTVFGSFSTITSECSIIRYSIIIFIPRY